MTISEMLIEQKMTKYRLSKNSQIPYATLSDICSGKTDLSKCSAETVYRLAKELHVSMEELLEPYLEHRQSFEIFKSNVCHRLKVLGDIDFLIETIGSDGIERYFDKKWYPEAFYMLAMVDYISRVNDVPMCNKYDKYRHEKLKEIIYPAGILCLSYAAGDNRYKEEALKNAIPEFLNFNIVESEIRDVV